MNLFQQFLDLLNSIFSARQKSHLSSLALIFGAFTSVLSVNSGAYAQQVIAVSENGQIRMLSTTRCATTYCRWVDIDNNPQTIAVAATQDSLFQHHQTGAIWVWNGQPCEDGRCPHWTRIDNNRSAIAISANNANLFQLHENGSIWRWLGQSCDGNRCGSWEMIQGVSGAVEISAGGTQLFQRREDGSIWRWGGEACNGSQCNSWTRLDRNSNTQQIAATQGALYQRHSNGSIWRWDGSACQGNRCNSWSLLDRNGATTSITAVPGGLYQRHSNGSVWRWLGATCQNNSCSSWERLDNNSRSQAIAGAAVPIRNEFSSVDPRPAPLYQVHDNGAVWRWDGEPCEGNRCLSWTRMSEGDSAFTGYSSERGGLYVLSGQAPRFASVASPNVASPEDFGFDSSQFARIDENTVQMNIVLLLTTYSNTSFEDDQTETYYRERFFGARESLEAYFQRNAPELEINMNLVDIVRVRDQRTLPCAHRWTLIAPVMPSDDDPGDVGRQGCTADNDGQPFTMATVEQLESLPAETVRDWAVYDRNLDGRLDTDELFVINLQGMPDRSFHNPFDDNGGLRRGYPRCAALQGTSERICGAFLPIADETNFVTVAHEIAHLFGGTDLYDPTGTANSAYTLMGGTISDNEFYFHLDPWHKMRMGFVRPRVIAIPSEASSRQSIRLTVPTNSADYEPVIFYDPRRGRDEFFMMEFRITNSGSYERDVPSSGLVIWSIRTLPGTFTPLDLQRINTNYLQAKAVAVIGAPNQSVAMGQAWTSANGIIDLNWPSVGDSGLHLRVNPFGTTSMFLTFDWWTE